MASLNIKYITNVRIPTPRAQGYAIMKMCSEFARAGSDVELFVPDRGGDESKKDPFGFYKIEKNFEIKKIPSFDFLGKTLKFGRFFYWIDIFSFLISAWLFVRIGENDILYTRDFLTLLFFSKRKNICLELHDMPASRSILRFVINKPELFFVLNNNLKEELVKMGVDGSKIHISPSGVDIEKFDINITKEEAREKLSQDPTSPFASLGLRGASKKIVMYSGQLYSWKGAETLACAASVVPEAVFVFVGGIEPELSEFREKYGKAANIIILPFQERDIIPAYLKAADVLVLPNSAREEVSVRFTSPLELFEYMASGKPIVASDLSSIREAIEEGECIFAKPDNPQSFAEAIKRILSDNSLAESISKAAFKKAEKYSWHKRAKNILSIINQR